MLKGLAEVELCFNILRISLAISWIQCLRYLHDGAYVVGCVGGRCTPRVVTLCTDDMARSDPKVAVVHPLTSES